MVPELLGLVLESAVRQASYRKLISLQQFEGCLGFLCYQLDLVHVYHDHRTSKVTLDCHSER